MATEIVYLGHDNTIDLILKDEDVAVSLAAVTKMTLTLGDVTLISTNQVGDPILWAQLGYATGEVHLDLGEEVIKPGNYEEAWLVVYDPTNTYGVVWGSFMVEVKADVELRRLA